MYIFKIIKYLIYNFIHIYDRNLILIRILILNWF